VRRRRDLCLTDGDGLSDIDLRAVIRACSPVLADAAVC
jgi:hypothetical protein